jgi:hypothetical protein
MTHLADKMKLLAGGTSTFAKQLEDKIDQKLAEHQKTQTDILNRVDSAFDTVDKISADANEGITAIEAELKGLTNQ